ncbi:hypothetical protein B0H19DRAFT_1255565 [Mycena capillaripes]|nr:hypothetical protein B0H19DRAFT_1255565 [Mycena capillaripes]
MAIASRDRAPTAKAYSAAPVREVKGNARKSAQIDSFLRNGLRAALQAPRPQGKMTARVARSRAPHRGECSCRISVSAEQNGGNGSTRASPVTTCRAENPRSFRRAILIRSNSHLRRRGRGPEMHQSPDARLRARLWRSTRQSCTFSKQPPSSCVLRFSRPGGPVYVRTRTPTVSSTLPHIHTTISLLSSPSSPCFPFAFVRRGSDEYSCSRVEWGVEVPFRFLSGRYQGYFKTPTLARSETPVPAGFPCADADILSPTLLSHFCTSPALGSREEPHIQETVNVETQPAS